MKKPAKNTYPWAFTSVGGTVRVKIRNGEDIRHLGELDRKMWTVLSCPVNNLEFDEKCLKYIDVDNDGKIVFPVIGILEVKGMTVRQCEAMIKQKITPYLSTTENPVVTVKMANFKVSVFGEVARPNSYTVSTGKINVLEALAQAGDMTIYGRRDNVTIIREDAQGKKIYHQMDLRDANIINDPFFYLQQNDIVYVEPNKVKTQNAAIGTSTTLTFSAVSILVSVASLIVNILR